MTDHAVISSMAGAFGFVICQVIYLHVRVDRVTRRVLALELEARLRRQDEKRIGVLK